MKMKGAVFWMLLMFLWTFSRGDPEVFCVFGEICVFPCSFQPAVNTTIHWSLLRAQDSLVHSYDNSKDQLGHQDQDFRGRTSLFQDQIARGNASLLLRALQVQDQGRYQCNTSTVGGNKVSLITVKVDAPVKTVNISQVGNKIFCSSDGIYPEPELTWSTIPPSNLLLRSATIKRPTKQHLYSISSSLNVSNSYSGVSYSCTVGTRSNNRTGSLLKQEEKVPGQSIALVLGCILVAAFMSMMPCFCNKVIKQHKKVEQPHQLEVVSTDQKQETEALNPEGKNDDGGTSCLEKTPATIKVHQVENLETSGNKLHSERGLNYRNV